MDSDGCRFYARCSETCTIERYTGDCNFTTPVTTTSPQTPTIITSRPTLPPGCVSSTHPPLQVCRFCAMIIEITSVLALYQKGMRKKQLPILHILVVRITLATGQYMA